MTNEELIAELRFMAQEWQGDNWGATTDRDDLARVMREAAAALSAQAAQPSPAALSGPTEGSEPVAWMYQHEETGQVGFVDPQQVEWGFFENNPRLHKVSPCYATPAASSMAGQGGDHG